MNHIAVGKRERAYVEMKRAARLLDEARYSLLMAAEYVAGTETSTALQLVSEAAKETRQLIDTNDEAA